MNAKEMWPGIHEFFTALYSDDPEGEVAKIKARNEAALAAAGTEEIARYATMTDEERREYDAMTRGMMPRLGI